LSCDSNGNCTANLKYQRDGAVTIVTETIPVLAVQADGGFGASLGASTPAYAGAIGNDGNVVMINTSFRDPLTTRTIYVGVRCSACANLEGGIFFPDYAPVALNSTWTYQYTYGPDTGQQYTSEVTGQETIPYTTGWITGGVITGMAGNPTGIGIGLNDGASVKFLGGSDDTGIVRYISTDCSLTTHPAAWSFDVVYDGMLIDQSGTYGVNKNDYSDCGGPDTQRILISIQDVTVQGTLYQDAVIMWYLDTNYSFTTLSLANLGLTLPTSADTGRYAVTNFDIDGYGIGTIANGDVDAATGSLVDLSELISYSP